MSIIEKEGRRLGMPAFNARAALRKRWYVAFVGLLLTLGAIIAVTSVVPAKTELTGRVLLLPPKPQTTTPDTPTNPYLRLGGLETVVGLVARGVTAPHKLESMAAQGGTGEIKVAPDPTMPGAVVMVTVDGKTREEAERTLELTLATLPNVLAELQTQVATPVKSFITSSVVDKDTQGKLVRKDQFRAVIMVGGAGTAGTILMTTLVDFLIMWRRRGGASRTDESAPFGPAAALSVDPAPLQASATWLGGSAPAPSGAALPQPLSGFDRSLPLPPYLANPARVGQPVGQVVPSLPGGVNGANGTSAPHPPSEQPAAGRLPGTSLLRQDTPQIDVGGTHPAFAGQGRAVGPTSLILPDHLLRDASGAGAPGSRRDPHHQGWTPDAAQPGAAKNGHGVLQGQPGVPGGAASDERPRPGAQAVPGPVSGASWMAAPAPAAPAPAAPGSSETGPTGQGRAVPGAGESELGAAQAAARLGVVRHASTLSPPSGPTDSVGSFADPSPVQPGSEAETNESDTAKVDAAAATGPPTGPFERLLHPGPKKPTLQDPDSRAAAHRLP